MANEPTTPTEEELAVIRGIGDDQDLSARAVMRQAIRHYQLTHERLKAGETLHWSGDAQRAAELAGPLATPTQDERDRRLGQMMREGGPDVVEKVARNIREAQQAAMRATLDESGPALSQSKLDVIAARAVLRTLEGMIDVES